MGAIRSPLFRKGGTTFGPKPRDYSYAMPKKARRNAIKSVLSEKIRNDRLFILDEVKLDSNKTKDAIKTLSKFVFDKLLIVDNKGNSDLMLSTRNIPHIKAIDVGEMNIYDSLNYNYIMLSVDVVKRLMEVLK
jgi:large subunit ribosomal protein L4